MERKGVFRSVTSAFAVTLITSVFLIVTTTSSVQAQYQCHITVFGQCWTDTCWRVCGGVLCGCSIQIPPKPIPAPIPKPALGTVNESTAASAIFQTSGNPFFYSPGNQFAGSLCTQSGSVFTYDPLIGGGSDAIPAATMSFVIGILQPHAYNSAYTDIRMMSFHATIPSFHSTALGLDTGLNVLNLATLENNQGLIENATGRFTIPVNAWLTNSIYSDANPGFFTVDITGQIDLSDPTHPVVHINGLPHVWGP